MGRRTVRVPVVRISATTELGALDRTDLVSVEEPLSIRHGHRPLNVLMRTPGDDFDLTLGWLITEGLIDAADQVHELRHCQDMGADGLPTYNSVDIALKPGVRLPEVGLDRDFPSTSGCGICGAATIAAIRRRAQHSLDTDTTPISGRLLLHLVEQLQSAQRDFQRTGGLHAAALFRDGELLVAREDIGRHNALDKVIGWAARNYQLPLRGCILMVSSRASVELAHKATMAGAPCLAAVSAPSSLAIDLAREVGLTLIAFLRPPRFTVYAGSERLAD
ncbi:MAG: formate dehydrogenase accessory sulfurtransferase FdhD [Angustibacter sp.]